MKATYWQRGEALDYKNTTGAKLEANTVIALGSRIGVIGCDIEAGATSPGSLHVMGVYILPKDTAAIDAGAEVYFDSGNDVITATSGASTVKAGYAVEAALAADTTVKVSINA